MAFYLLPDFSFNIYCKLLHCLRQYLTLWFVIEQANCITILLDHCCKFEKALINNVAFTEYQTCSSQKITSGVEN